MLVNDAVAVDGAAAPTHVLMIGGKAFSGVPTEETANDVVAPWCDLNRRLILYSFDFSSEALSVEDVAPAVFAPFEPVSMTQLTAPGNTDPIEVRSFNMVSMQVIVASIDTNVVVRIDGSHDGTNYFPLALDDRQAVANLTYSGAQATIAANGTYVVTVLGLSTRYARGVFVSESASPSAATLDITMKAKS